MTSAINSNNSSLEALTSAYTTTEKTEDPLGRDAFLTMLVAQLQNQDPLNPLDGTAFTAQLAQFSSLEQQFDMNDNLEKINSTLEKGNDPNLVSYIGKEISSVSNTIDVNNGAVSVTGNFTLTESTAVAATIYNEAGEVVKTMNLGQLDKGTNQLTWNGKDNDGNVVDDGQYTYELSALNDSGAYAYAISPTVEGEVDGVVYNNGVGYLSVGDTIVSPSSIVGISQPDA